MTQVYSEETRLSMLPAYMAEKLGTRLQEWLITEQEVKSEGGQYDARARMRHSLELAITAGSVGRILDIQGNYSWIDYWLGVAGRGLFIRQDFSAEAKKIALQSAKKWMDAMLPIS